MTKLFTLVISGAVSGGIFAIVAAGLVLTYQTSGIFNFAHGAVRVHDRAVVFRAALARGRRLADRPGGDRVGPRVRAAPRARSRPAAPSPPCERAGVRADHGDDRSARRPARARAVGHRAGQRHLPLGPAVDRAGGPPAGARPGSARGLAPHRRASRSTPIRSRCSSPPRSTALLLWYVLRKTRIGLNMRAAVDRQGLARLRGIDTGRTSAVAWVLTMILAGLAGVLLAPFLELAPFSFTSVVLGSIVAVVVARFRSIPVAFAAGLLFGVVTNLLYGYVPDYLPFLDEISGFNSSIPYVLAFVALLVLGQVGGRAAGTAVGVRGAATGPPHRAYRRGGGGSHGSWPRPCSSGAVQFVADDFWASQVASGLVLSLVFLSFVVVTGLGGMVSLAQAMFVTTGGFVAGWLVNKRFDTDIPVLTNDGRPELPGGGTERGDRRGARRTRSSRCRSASWVSSSSRWRPCRSRSSASCSSSRWTRSATARPATSSMRRRSAGTTSTIPARCRCCCSVLVALISLFINNLQRSPSGRAMLAVRSSEVAARTAGISPVRSKVALFAVSAAIAGLGGAMFAAVNSPFSYRQRARADRFDLVGGDGVVRDPPPRWRHHRRALLLAVRRVPRDRGRLSRRALDVDPRQRPRGARVSALRSHPVRPGRDQPGPEPRRGPRDRRPATAREATQAGGARGHVPRLRPRPRARRRRPNRFRPPRRARHCRSSAFERATARWRCSTVSTSRWRPVRR